MTCAAAAKTFAAAAGGGGEAAAMIPPPCHKGRQDACFPAFAGKGRRMWRLRLPHVVMKRYRRFPHSETDRPSPNGT